MDMGSTIAFIKALGGGSGGGISSVDFPFNSVLTQYYEASFIDSIIEQMPFVINRYEPYMNGPPADWPNIDRYPCYFAKEEYEIGERPYHGYIWLAIPRVTGDGSTTTDQRSVDYGITIAHRYAVVLHNGYSGEAPDTVFLYNAETNRYEKQS